MRIRSWARFIRRRYGRPIEVTDEKNVQRVRELIETDPRVTYEDIKDLLNIWHKYFRVKKIFCRWVPHLLSEEQNSIQVKVCQENLKILSCCGHWLELCHYYDAPTNQESKIWIFEVESPTNQLKQKQTFGKILLKPSS